MERMDGKLLRKIIQIDEDKCNDCGACAAGCYEGAAGMEGGKEDCRNKFLRIFESGKAFIQG